MKRYFAFKIDYPLWCALYMQSPLTRIIWGGARSDLHYWLKLQKLCCFAMSTIFSLIPFRLINTLIIINEVLNLVSVHGHCNPETTIIQILQVNRLWCPLKLETNYLQLATLRMVLRVRISVDAGLPTLFRLLWMG